MNGGGVAPGAGDGELTVFPPAAFQASRPPLIAPALR